MTRRVELSGKQQRELEKRFRASEDVAERNRIQAVLMAARGVERQDIATSLCCTPRTIQRYIADFLERHKLTAGRAPGRARTIPVEMEPLIREWIRKGPSAFGLQRANWTYEELAAERVNDFETGGVCFLTKVIR